MTSNTWVAFVGDKRIAFGTPIDVAAAVRLCTDTAVSERIAIFDEATGRAVDVDLSGSERDVLARIAEGPKRGPGRPKLGVVSREVSLLPRHWSWLNTQRGGASAALRRLVEAARKSESSSDAARAAVDVTHRFLWDIAGDLPDFEEATRALFAHDMARLDEHMHSWPPDIREQAQRFTAALRD